MQSGRTGVCPLMIMLAIATAAPAYGYTDPGSGALIYQILVAGFLSAGFYFRRFLEKIWRKRK